MYTKILVAVLVAVCVGQSFAIKWKDCGKPGGNVKNVNVVGCETVDVCPIKKGVNASITFDFTAGFAAKNATSIVHGILDLIPIPFPLPQPYACNTAGSGLTCPLKAGTAYSYNSIIPVLKSYPAISVTVKWELQDETGKDIFCALMPVTIVS